MISEFQGEYRWLSNFEPCSITFEGVTYPSVEHAYMSAKSDEPKWKSFCAGNVPPGVVKKISRTIKLVNNWEEIKVSVMRECIEQKYDQEPYKTKLIATKDEYLQEGNRWGDKFWGVCLRTGIGENMLGILIMTKRKQLLTAKKEEER